MNEVPKLDELCVNTLRFLAVDMVQRADSGHPGLPMGAAAMAYALWTRFLKFNPTDPAWANRDRFVLSAGHGSALLYSLLHLTGFDLPMTELQKFRQWKSKTPGHPEHGETPGVEATTGPLGQGFANAVGMAMAERNLAARFNQPGHEIVDHHTYVLASDGDLMEGVASEAASLAGHLGLGKLIVLYDDNRISIEGSTELAFTEDAVARFGAYGWHTERVSEGNNLATISQAIEKAQAIRDKPSLIAVRTHIGFGSPNKQDSAGAHGEPLGEAEIKLSRKNLGFPEEPTFLVPKEALDHFRQSVTQGKELQNDWQQKLSAYADAFPKLSQEWKRLEQKRLPENWDQKLVPFKADAKGMATREASGVVINQLAASIPEFLGGSADLGPSTKTLIKDGGDFEPKNPAGRNLHFGIREHAMGSILNGMALHQGVIAYGATFLIFSDYMRPPMRLAAMNQLPVVYVFTHDSIGLGEDGPTHQAVEQLLGLRSVSGLDVMRPADANETLQAWKYAMTHRDRPMALALTRQKIPVLSAEAYPNLEKGFAMGAYILAETAHPGKLDLIIMATGSEVHLALEAREKLSKEGLGIRVVSMPCISLFQRQSETYRKSLFPHAVPRLAIEAGSELGWKSYLDDGPEVIGIKHYGASAPGDRVMNEYGFNVNHVCEKARALVGK